MFLEIMAALNEKSKTARRSTQGIGNLNRRTSHISLRDHLKKNSFPEASKTQMAVGSDFYLDIDMLAQLERHYKEEYVPSARAKDQRRWALFGFELIAELVGGRDVLEEGLKHVFGGLMAVIGDDILQASYCKSKLTRPC